MFHIISVRLRGIFRGKNLPQNSRCQSVKYFNEASPQTNESKPKAKNQGISHEATEHTKEDDSKFMI
jgi:hypothetical protein